MLSEILPLSGEIATVLLGEHAKLFAGGFTNVCERTEKSYEIEQD